MGQGPYKEYVVDGALLVCDANFHGCSVLLRVEDRGKKIQGKACATEADKKILHDFWGGCLKCDKPCEEEYELLDWDNPRAVVCKARTAGEFQLLDDATIPCKHGGTLSFVTSGQESTVDIPGGSSTSRAIRERWFGATNLNKIGTIGLSGDDEGSINYNSARYSESVHQGVVPPSPGLGDFGSPMGAMRHAIWQATITSKYSRGTAKSAGDAHEENSEALNQASAARDGGLEVCRALTQDEADCLVDLHNNVLGRQIGSKAEYDKSYDIALAVLDHYKNEGLYTLKAIPDKDGNPTGYYKMVKSKLTQDQYELALEELNRIDESIEDPLLIEDQTYYLIHGR